MDAVDRQEARCRQLVRACIELTARPWPRAAFKPGIMMAFDRLETVVEVGRLLGLTQDQGEGEAA